MRPGLLSPKSAVTLACALSLAWISSGCELAVGPSSGPTPLSLRNTVLASSAYSGATLSTQPAFAVYKGGSLDSSYAGSVSLSAYLDSSCTVPVDGTFNIDQSSVLMSGGSASFSGIAYTLPGHLEESLYFGAETSGGLSVCTQGTRILQHFNAGTGAIVGGSTGFAGATGASESDWVYALRIDSEGRYIVTDSSKNAAGGRELALVRYNPDGTLDTTFGSGAGYVLSGSTGAAGATGASENDQATYLQIDSQGRYVVIGTSKNTSGGTELAIWRYNTDGTLDTTFGSGAGYVVSGATGTAGATGASEADWPYGFEFDSQGKIVIGDSSKNTAGGWELAILRYNTDGSLDTTFGSGAGYIVSGSTGAAGATGASENDFPITLRIDSQGRYVLAGGSENPSGGVEFAVWRYNSDGSLDTTFGSGVGFVVFGATGVSGATGASEYDIAYAPLQFDSQGKYVIAGMSYYSSGGYELAIWRYNTDGTLDTTFGSGAGFIGSGSTGAAGATGASEADYATGLQIDSQGRYVLAGGSNNTSGGAEAAV